MARLAEAEPCKVCTTSALPTPRSSAHPRAFALILLAMPTLTDARSCSLLSPSPAPFPLTADPRPPAHLRWWWTSWVLPTPPMSSSSTSCPRTTADTGVRVCVCVRYVDVCICVRACMCDTAGGARPYLTRAARLPCRPCLAMCLITLSASCCVSRSVRLRLPQRRHEPDRQQAGVRALVGGGS